VALVYGTGLRSGDPASFHIFQESARPVPGALVCEWEDGAIEVYYRGERVVFIARAIHAPIYEKVEEFNQKTLQFLRRHTGAGTS
jgi:hypothetical protein